MEFVTVDNVKITSIEGVEYLFDKYHVINNKDDDYFSFSCVFALKDKEQFNIDEELRVKFSISPRKYFRNIGPEDVLNYSKELFNNKEAILEFLKGSGGSTSIYRNYRYSNLTQLKIEKSIKLFNKLTNIMNSNMDLKLVNELLINLTNRCMTFNNINIYKPGLRSYFVSTPFAKDLFYDEIPEIIRKMIVTSPTFKKRFLELIANNMSLL